MVNWGETGGSDEPATVVQGSGFGTVTSSHAYAAGGVYTVTLTLTDDDTGVAVSSTMAVVVGAGVNHGVLQIVGSDQGDIVRVSNAAGGSYEVQADFFADGDARLFGPGGVEQIEVWLCEGDDHIDLYGLRSFSGPVIVRGGAGDDVIYGSAVDDILLGDSGNDVIFGGLGNNIIIGGLGADRIYGVWAKT